MSKLAQGKTVLITGASTGVGEVLACCLAREGAKLILISEEKTQDQLKQARDGGWVAAATGSPRVGKEAPPPGAADSLPFLSKVPCSAGTLLKVLQRLRQSGHSVDSMPHLGCL